MHAVLVTRESATDFRREPLFETCVEALTNAAVPARFVF
jgi:hypothetical protein